MKLFLSPEKHIDTAQGIDISLPLSPSKGALAWYCEPIKIWPVKGDGFIGKVSEGGATNFNNIQLNPHGNGTHTENVGHISKEFYNINDSLTQFHFISNLVTVKPKPFFNEDWQEQDLIIDEDVLKSVLDHKDQHEALIIRTQPNTLLKKNKNYSHTNPPYLTEGGVKYINSIGVKHLLIDLPSVDRENDHGALKAHRAFWNYPDAPILDKTITELIYVPDEISDGIYVLNLQIISLENDASPSKPILYEIRG